MSEWVGFYLFDLVWFWKNQSDNKEPILGIWLGLSHRVGSVIYYWFMNEKGHLILCNTIQHLTAGEPRYTNIQQQIHDYHRLLEDALKSDNFVTGLDRYDTFINYYE